MSPFDFYFSDSSAELDQCDFKAPKSLAAGEVQARFGFAPDFAHQHFEAPIDFPLGSYYKKDGNDVLAISPFGAYRFDCTDLFEKNPMQEDQGIELRFRCFANSSSNALMSWPVQLKNDWADALGEIPHVWMRAKPHSDGSWTPPYCSHQMRKSGQAELHYCTVLLPSPALRIEAVKGGVRMVTDQHTFIIDDDSSAKVILAGHVRWGYPQADGTFALEPRLF